MALEGLKFNASVRAAGKLFSEESSWQEPVLAIQTNATLDPGASPATGARYILTATGALNANFGSITGVGDDDIVEYDGSAFVVVWDASANTSGAQCYNEDTNAFVSYDETSWSAPSSPDGGDGVTFNGGSNRYDLDLATSSGLELTAADGTGELQIAADGVTEARIADGAVTTDKLGAAAVTDAKVASGIDAAKLSAGSVSNTEFDFLDGVTSAIQTQLDAKQETSEKGVANGYASLDATGKLPASQLPTSAQEYKGAWDASTNTPTLANGTGTNGDLYRVSAAGSVDFGAGSISFVAGDVVIYNGTIWEKVPGDDQVLSVNGATGAVTVNAINELTGDVTAGPASGSASAAATISALAVTEGKIADDAVTSGKLATDAVGADALDFAGTNLRSGVVTDSFPSLSRTFTHNWATQDVDVQVYDTVTGETCWSEVTRASNSVSITVNQTPANPLRVMLAERGAQTTITVS